MAEDIFLGLDLLSETKQVFYTKIDDWRGDEQLRLEALVGVEEVASPQSPKQENQVPPPDYPYLVIRTHDFPYVVAFYNSVSIAGCVPAPSPSTRSWRALFSVNTVWYPVV